MNILILEDEPPIAEYIKDLTCSLIGSEIDRIDIVHTLRDAEAFLEARSIDLCLLDLNLNEASGYELLKNTVSRSFHAIIISVHTDQAYEAFRYGVLDFVPKPVNRERLRQAFDRYFGVRESRENRLQYLVTRKQKTNHFIPVEEVLFFEAERYLVKAHLKNGKQELIEKSLNRLMQILPTGFLRVHRSYIVPLDQIASYHHRKGGTYEILLKNHVSIPMSPSFRKTLDRLTHRND